MRSQKPRLERGFCLMGAAPPYTRLSKQRHSPTEEGYRYTPVTA